MEYRHRLKPDGKWWFVTLTLPKLPHHLCSAREALQRVMDVWAELTKGNTIPGRSFRQFFPGGVRTIEVTFSQKGDRHGDHVVEYDGFHVHLHLLLELGDDVAEWHAREWLLQRWLELVPGASASAQKILDADMRRVGQLTKYVTKPLEDAARLPDIARELFQALHGRRLMHGYGTWKDWKKWDAEDEKPFEPDPMLECSVDLGQLLRITMPGSGCSGGVYFEGFVRGERVRVRRLASDVWDELERSARSSARRISEASAEAEPPPRFRSDPGLTFWSSRGTDETSSERRLD